MGMFDDLVISHRGNLTGPHSAPYGENRILSILAVLSAGYHVEVDIWEDDGFWLGHDSPEVKLDYLDLNLLTNPYIWWHCKNIKALQMLLQNSDTTCFFHSQDDCTLTSNGYIWTFPGKYPIGPRSISVSPEKGFNGDWRNGAGVCTDYPSLYKC